MMGLIGGRSTPPGGGTFDPTSIFGSGEQGIIYDLTNSATVFQERTGASATTPSGDVEPIGSLKDLSPNNNYCVAPTDGQRPLWNSAGYLSTDGVDDLLNALFTMNQTYCRVSCIRINTHVSERIYSDGSGAGGGFLFNVSGDDIGIYAGSTLTIATQTAGSDFVITERYSGATSRGALNNGSYVTGDAGTGNASGITIANTNPASLATSGRFYRIIMIDRDLTDVEIANCRTWCGAAAGLTL